MKKKLLDRIDVRKPCSESWEEMTGNSEVRFCSHCSKDVYDLSTMTRAKAERFVRDSNGRLCVRYVKDARGKVVTATPRLTQIKRQATVAAGVLAASLTFSSLAYAQGKPVKLGELKADSEQGVSKKDPRSGGRSSISGEVLDMNGAVVPGTKVTLRKYKDGEIKITQSDERGRYEFVEIESGIFDIEAVSPGFLKLILTNISITEPATLLKNLTLEAGAIVGELLVLEGPPVEASEPKLQTEIQTRPLLELPRGRTFTLGLFTVPSDSSKPAKRKKNKNKLPK
ncbi:MAG: carboxypeptidase-like regulatory domain-containing protein [Acidobacteriota bacterium]